MSGSLRYGLALAVAACALLLVPAAAFASDQSPFAPGGGITMPDGDEYSSEPGADETTTGSDGGLWFTSVDGVAIATILFALGFALQHRRLKRRRQLWRSGRDPPQSALGEFHSQERSDTGRFERHDASPVTAARESSQLLTFLFGVRAALYARCGGPAGEEHVHSTRARGALGHSRGDLVIAPSVTVEGGLQQ